MRTRRTVSAETRSIPRAGPEKLLGALRVKVENYQVNEGYKIEYRLYPLRLLTVKLASYRGDTEKRVQRVPKLIRFDKAVPEGC